MNLVRLEVTNQYNQLFSPEAPTKKLFETINSSEAFPILAGELSIAFVSDEVITRIHRDFMDVPTPTDVITFPANPEMESAGEIIVSVDHARARAKELGEPFSRELSLYLIHGWLHLAGYDDRNNTDRASMRSAEQKALNILAEAQVDPAFKVMSATN